ncbi:MAG: glycoside hydrolase family 9 protein [Bacteroidota bacterium]
MSKHFFTLSLLCCAQFLFAQVSTFIHLDQFGYWPDAEKVAVLSDPQVGFNAADSYSPASTLELRSASTDNVIYSGSPQAFNGGQTDASSGDRGWWFDFSSVSTPGSYYVYDPINDERSAFFEIRDNPYHDILVAAGRMYFYNRCNAPKAAPYAEANWTDGNNFLNPLQDANCRYIFDPGNAALEKDLRGGWFDAGDYNKYVTFTEETLHNLLAAYEENPGAFGDNWNIPESGNGIPDLLDEIKWELDWMLKMINSDGSAHIKMGSQNFSENSASPPSNNFDQRFYGPTCSSASAASASVLSHAALVLQGIEGLAGYAATLSDNAVRTFAYALDRFESGTLETNCDDGSIIAGDADRNEQQQLESLLAASFYLRALTAEGNYEQFFLEQYANTTPMINNFWGGDQLFVQDALINYLQLNSGSPTVQQAIQSSVSNAVNNNWNGFFGWTENDLYRSFAPNWTYNWGSNRPKANYGSLNFQMIANQLGNNPATLERKATEHLHYFHGVNPLGMVMLSNMYSYGGDRCVNEIYHAWFADGTEYDHALNSPKGPAPGFVTGGPNAAFSVTTLSPPANQPDQKSYLDFNDSWPNSSWEITEPAIYYQASYIRFLAHFVEGEEIVNTENEPTATIVSTFPNPTGGQTQLKVPSGSYQLRIMDLQGRTLQQYEWQSGTPVDLQQLPAGTYVVEATSEDQSAVYQVKVAKQ